MDSKFAINMVEYQTVTVICPDCSAKYLLKLRREHSALSTKDNGMIKVRCPDCCKAKRGGLNNA
jgi:ribosomal protein S27E